MVLLSAKLFKEFSNFLKIYLSRFAIYKLYYHENISRYFSYQIILNVKEPYHSEETHEALMWMAFKIQFWNILTLEHIS